MTGCLKAGGIRFAENPNEAGKVAGEILGSEIKEFGVEKVLVEERLNIDKEYYAGIIVDDSYRVRAPVLMFSTEGGGDIEEVADRSPEKIARVTIDDSSVSRHPELGIQVTRESARLPTDLDRITWKIEKDDYRGSASSSFLFPCVSSLIL